MNSTFNEKDAREHILQSLRNSRSMFRYGEQSQIETKPRKKTVKKRKSVVREEEKIDVVVENSDESSTGTESSSTRAPKRKRENELLLYEKKEFQKMDTYDKSLVLLEKRRRLEREMVPEWHAPWKLFRVISAHLGWVRAIDVDITNEFFVSGSSDRTIKIWDLASGKLKLTLTGHVNTIRALKISERHPYLFSVGEDKMIKCWDMEQNQQIKAYHGHLSGIYCVDLHPTLNLVVTGGRDASARVWDIRTKAEVFILTGHSANVTSVKCQSGEPQIITGSSDKTVRLWDLKTGKTMTILTNHKKSVRSVLIHPTEYTFASAAADSIKKWLCPKGRFLQTLDYTKSRIVNCMSINNDNVLFSGGDDGTLTFWDWKTGYNYQEFKTTPQSGSLEAEAGVLCSTFDRSGARLLTGEVDKTIKIWREDKKATPQTHPVNMVYKPKSFY